MNRIKPLLIALAATASFGGNLLWAAPKKAPASPKARSVPSAKADKARREGLKDGFVPGVYPGVMVRRVPLAKSQYGAQAATKEKAGLVRVLPGGKLPPRVARPGGKSVSVRRQGQSRKGGVAVNLPEHRIPRVTAHRDKNGKVVVD